MKPPGRARRLRALAKRRIWGTARPIPPDVEPLGILPTKRQLKILRRAALEGGAAEDVVPWEHSRPRP